MQAERYVSGFKYTYISPPNTVTNSQLFTNNSNGHFNPNFYSYNQAFAAPSDPATGTYAEWELGANNFSDAWVEAHDDDFAGSGIILNVAGRGYAYYNDIDKMFVFDGTFTTGNNDITLTYDSNDGNADYFDGWNLIANPYPSALNWDDGSWTKTHVDAAIYYWDGTNSNEGNYKYYVSSGSYDDGTDVVNGGSQMIPASQAFFVKAKASAGSGGQALTIPNDARTHSTQSYWNKNAKSGSSQFIRLQATANNATDELVVRYISEGTENYDGQFDAYKMYSRSVNTPQIYSYNEEIGAGYAINSLPVSSMQNAIPIGMEIGKTGESECTISLTEFNIENQHIYFEDTEENITQNMRTNPAYSYIIADSSDIRERFYISYEENTAPIATGEIDNYSINFDEVVSYEINTDIFEDANAGDELIFEAFLSNDEVLPAWLNFDNQIQTFTGTPEIAEILNIKIVVTDIFGESVIKEFELAVNTILPEVSTNEITDITSETAQISGILLSNGGVDIEVVGVCWSENENPTLNDDFSVEILNENQFIGFADNLQANTTYYVRSYATNSVGTQYGNQLSFTTLETSISTFEDNKLFEIYPNPTSNFVIVNLSGFENLTGLNLQITDVTGRIVNESFVNTSNFTINLSDLEKGIYFIKIKDNENNEFVEKLILK